MTATVSFASKTPNAMLKVPLTALLQEKNRRPRSGWSTMVSSS
ncbi:hypothetical protein ACFS07_21220 [Undibacterium arcticum]